ncbi:hypothetical protein J4727_18095 [Providencia rettgeri]|uniref:Uncharacterized protein n=1 Tax=Providencia rettgeri TaxID=587 RepID=A0A939ND24_PRORE|nr:hypothetical protein [Providencia rettgeri]
MALAELHAVKVIKNTLKQIVCAHRSTFFLFIVYHHPVLLFFVSLLALVDVERYVFLIFLLSCNLLCHLLVIRKMPLVIKPAANETASAINAMAIFH